MLYKLFVIIFLIPLFVFANPQELPLISLNDFEYEGAFRINTGTFGDSSIAYSKGRITYNEDRNSIYVVGYDNVNAIAEFSMPEFGSSLDIDLKGLPITEEPLQNYYRVFDRADTGNTQNTDRITGLEYVDGQLIVNGNEWYDAGADNTHTTLVIKDANDLQNSNVDGFFELDGRAQGAGWISEIPQEWQTLLGGNYISGYSSVDSIISRFSVGPSAYVIDINDLTNSQSSSGQISAQEVLGYSYSKSMYPLDSNFDFSNSEFDQTVYNYRGGRIPCEDVDGDRVCYHDQADVLDNDLWTIKSQARHGFIVPGTRTYAVFGSSAGHDTGIGYKNVQTNGNVCGGPCEHDPEDSYNYYWFFDVNDLVRVRGGEINPEDVRPYDYGEFQTPFDFAEGNYQYGNYRSGNGRIGSADYNYEENILYLSLPNIGWDQSLYSPSTVILGYRVNTNGSSGGGGVEPPVVTYSLGLSTSNTQVDIGDDITLSWASEGLDTCIASGSWSGSKALSGSEIININSVSQTSFTLTCTNSSASQEIIRTVDITVNDEPVVEVPQTPSSFYFDSVCPALPQSQGNSVTVSPSQALDLRNIAMNAQTGTTIYLEDGFYNLSSSWRIQFSNPGVTLRSLSGNKSAVILSGDYSSTGAAEIIYINVPDITIADLTLQNAWYHPIHIVGDGDNALIYNLNIIDGAEQFIKINGDNGEYSDNGQIMCSYFELTDQGSSNVRNNCYTGGIDAHSAYNWTIKNNVFKNIYCRDGGGVAEHAVHFWRQGRDNVVDSNLIINSARGIGFGLSPGTVSRTYDDNVLDSYGLDYSQIEQIGGVIKNNLIYSDIGSFADTGIGLEGAVGADVFHNTIYLINPAFSAIDARWEGSQDIEIKNNLYFPDYISIRNNAQTDQQNNIVANQNMFEDIATYNFNILDTSSPYNSGLSLGVTRDIFDNLRPQGQSSDVGAFEFFEGQTPSPVCGNNMVEVGETCDDGNTINGDGCSSVCILEVQQGNLPLIDVSDFNYLGGFRIDYLSSGEANGETRWPVAYSRARIAHNPQANSIFLTGRHSIGGTNQGIAEFQIPEIVNSNQIVDLNFATQLQDFTPVLQSPPSGNLHELDHIGGMKYIDGELFLTTYRQYEQYQNGVNRQNGFIINDPENLDTTTFRGYYEIEGNDHVNHWISEIPVEWRDELNGDFIAGGTSDQAHNPRSVGPSAFVFNSSDIIGNDQFVEPLQTQAVLDFSMAHAMAKTESGWTDNWDLFNEGGDNDLWTSESRGWIGFIIPGTSTYAVIGETGGINDGTCYKNENDPNPYCRPENCYGYCLENPLDAHNYYWFFDVNDLIEVKNGNTLPWEVKPYDYGIFPTPFDLVDGNKNLISGATYDKENNILYVSLRQADRLQDQYVFTPLILAFNISVEQNQEPEVGICGNNVIEGNEECDTYSFNGLTCGDYGFDSGVLTCSNSCTIGIDSCSSSNQNQTDQNQTDDGGDNSNGDQDNSDDGGSSDSSGSSSSSGGSSGGGGGSSSSGSLISNFFSSGDDYVAPVCLSNYDEGDWSVCLNGEQSRVIIDLNSCQDEIQEVRKCQIGLNEIDTQFLNAKLIDVRKQGSRMYRTKLDSSYNEIVFMEAKLEDESFVLVDNATGIEYLGRLIEESDEKYYYSLSRVDENNFDELKSEGILTSTVGEDISDIVKSNVFYQVMIVLVVCLFVTGIFATIFYIKRLHKKELVEVNSDFNKKD